MSFGAPGCRAWSWNWKKSTVSLTALFLPKNPNFFGGKDPWVPCERQHMSPDPIDFVLAHESRENYSLSKSSENSPLACCPSEKPSYSAFCGLITVA